MPRLRRKARQAKQQRASRGKYFDHGHIELDTSFDPTYEPEPPEDEGSDDGQPWAFSLAEKGVLEDMGDEGWANSPDSVSSKSNSEDMGSEVDIEGVCAADAARKARTFWNNLLAESVSVHCHVC